MAAHLLDVGVDERRADQGLVVEIKLGVRHPDGFRQPPPQFGVGNRLSEWSDRRFVPTEIEMTPRRDHIDMLELGGGGEDDVGVAGRVGEELFADNREQILALQSLAG